MVVGHIAAGLVISAWRRDIPLGHLLIAVNLVDLIWLLANICGFEHFSIEPIVSPSNNALYALLFWDQKYSHALLPTVAVSLISVLFYQRWQNQLSWPKSMTIGLAIFSHWWLDLIVHRPDLLVIESIPLVGFALWKVFWPSVLLEILMIVTASYCYALRKTLLPDQIKRSDVAQFFTSNGDLFAFTLLLALLHIALSVLPLRGTLEQVSRLKAETTFSIAFFFAIIGIALVGNIIDSRRGARL